MLVGSQEAKASKIYLSRNHDTDFRVAWGYVDREEIYRLRYEAYIREGTINANPSKLFHDDYDEFDNCFVFGLFLDDQLVSSVRLHVISPKNRYGPALDVFPDIVSPMVDRGMTLIDPTRFVVDCEAAKHYKVLPYLTLKAACMAIRHFSADYCLATVRKEHCAFYRKVFQAHLMCEPRPYPTLNQPICLMRTDIADVWDAVMEKYPIFVSTEEERFRAFEQSRLLGGEPFGGVGEQAILKN